jgi:hypothetical protein
MPMRAHKRRTAGGEPAPIAASAKAAIIAVTPPMMEISRPLAAGVPEAEEEVGVDPMLPIRVNTAHTQDINIDD